MFSVVNSFEGEFGWVIILGLFPACTIIYMVILILIEIKLLTDFWIE